jgi:hypothetical protein
MSCCGKSRAQIKASLPSRNTNVPPQRVNVPLPPGSVVFEYTGRSRLTVIGPVTHRRYEFIGFGARVQVDPRDAPSVATVPSLRRV